jgi:hypothetical protein
LYIGSRTSFDGGEPKKLIRGATKRVNQLLRRYLFQRSKIYPLNFVWLFAVFGLSSVDDTNAYARTTRLTSTVDCGALFVLRIVQVRIVSFSRHGLWGSLRGEVASSAQNPVPAFLCTTTKDGGFPTS